MSLLGMAAREYFSNLPSFMASHQHLSSPNLKTWSFESEHPKRWTQLYLLAWGLRLRSRSVCSTWLSLTERIYRSTSLQHQAVQNAKNALLAQTNGSLLFQQCLESHEPIPSLVQTLIASHEQHAVKRTTRLIVKFQTHTIWLQNMAIAIDVAANASPGFICPVWAPLRYILKVYSPLPACSPCCSTDFSFRSRKVMSKPWSVF
jgi:hypothetical protein